MTDKRRVLLLFFDLPMQTRRDRRNYRRMRKTILANGYQRIQDSVYVKLLGAHASLDAEYGTVYQCTEEGAQVMLLPLSFGAFSSLQCVRGTPFDFSFFSDEILYL